MDHREYIEQYLSADADDELTSAERREVSAHLTECSDCREKLRAERALKQLIRGEFPILTAPDSLQQRVRQGLDEIDSSAPSRQRSAPRTVAWVAAAALAASLVLLTINLRGRAGNPLFDSAIASFESSQTSFAPTVGTRSVDDLATTLINQFGVALVWDFRSLGMTAVGGRIEYTKDGKPVAYAMYKGADKSLLCIIKREDVMPRLAGGTVVNGIHIYKYKGLTVAATNRYSVFCVMVTNAPPDEVARALAKQPA